jgi:hypothetical protein
VLRASVGSTEAAKDVVARFGVSSDRSEIVQGDGTPLELFLAGIRALALQSRIVRILTGHAGK